ncbi:potassium channel protein [Helicobacter enhydrae]|uniref:Potassium channel protein n=1 Tax=Helicobacter enhydrae TaxID=222136 RepID=A0A1B1U518_9HELI|nr:potassium channel protein [Helicobacter enhydrae]ANV97785.1 potassium channel protein [Helicobacter enhydrae]
MLKKIKKILHWRDQKQQVEVDLSSALYEQLKYFRLPLVLIQIFLLIGTLGYLWLEDYNLMDAFFQAAYTFTNTGFGSLKEEEFTPLSIIFTTIIMFSGAGVIAFSVATVVSIINDGRLIRLIREKKMVQKIVRLRNHYVVCYHNEYTIELARQFREAQIPFVVVDNQPNFEEEAKKHKYPYYIVGDPHTDTAILKTHLASAKGIVSFSKIPADNIALIVSVRLFEKELGRKAYYVIASADSQEDIDRLKKLGANSVVSATKLMAQRVSAMAIRPDMENLLEQFAYKKDTQLDLEEVVVPKYSWLVLKKLKDAHFRAVTQVSIVGITQKDGKYITMPTGETIVPSESKLLMIGTSEGIRETKRLILRREKPDEIKKQDK